MIFVIYVGEINQYATGLIDRAFTMDVLFHPGH